MENYLDSLGKANKIIQIADHMTYITYGLLKDKRLLIKILGELYLGVMNMINSILQYEHMYKRIQIYKEAKDNFNTFLDLCSRYRISEEQKKIIEEIIKLEEKHKKSPFEFVKEDKIVIMSEGFKTDILTLDKLKYFLLNVKDIYKKINVQIKN